MAVISIAATEDGHGKALGAVADALARKGHDATVTPPESAGARVPQAQFVVRI